jgi:8-oxo-dGTP diphosphatase
MQKGVDFIGVSVSYFCHDGQGNYLFAKRGAGARDEHGKWDCGGGGLEFDETVEEALIREIKEEYCTEILGSEFVGFHEAKRTHNGKATHWIALHFKVLVDRNQVKNGEPHKVDELGWFRLDNLPPASELHSQLPAEIKKYKGKL